MELLKQFSKKRIQSRCHALYRRRARCVLHALLVLQLLQGLIPYKNALADTLFKPDGTCARSFVYRNRTYPVDSSRKLDGEGLRFLLKKQGQAEAMLNSYQSRLKSSRIPAYTGTLGLILAVGGPMYAGTLDTPLGQRDTRTIFVASGIALALGSYIYGQWAFKSKENILENAVNSYNDSVPEPEQIRVELTPLPTGSGGEIKTQVPLPF